MPRQGAVIPDEKSKQATPYEEAANHFGAALGRLARAYEADDDKRRDLLQGIHIALWCSLDGFNGACSLRTWVYRVAHNVATSHVLRERRQRQMSVGLEDLENLPATVNGEREAGDQQMVQRILEMIRQLKPIDRQVILSYLEGMDAATIAEISGLSAANVATKIYRIKNILSRRFRQGGRHAE